MRSETGFTLLLSVLVVSIILAVSLGISSIIRGEIILSFAGRQSQLAFYAADAGLECAIYWDTVRDGDPVSYFSTTTQNSGQIECTGVSHSVGGWPTCVDSLDGTGSPSPCSEDVFNPDDPPQLVEDKKAGFSVFAIEFSNGSCAHVEVIKRQFYEYDPDDPTPIEAGIEAFIHSDGFSEGTIQGTDCVSASSRVLQRSIETTTFE